MKYVFIKKFEDGSEGISIIEDPIALFKNGDLREENGDRLFQLGEEVKVEMNIKIKSKTVYRGAPPPQHITFDGGPSKLMNDDLGVGDYRG